LGRQPGLDRGDRLCTPVYLLSARACPRFSLLTIIRTGQDRSPANKAETYKTGSLSSAVLQLQHETRFNDLQSPVHESEKQSDSERCAYCSILPEQTRRIARGLPVEAFHFRQLPAAG
jgi:hypothetical protein